MNAIRRRGYLDVLGIEPWVARLTPPTPAAEMPTVYPEAHLETLAASAREKSIPEFPGAPSSRLPPPDNTVNDMAKPAVTPIPAREVPTDWAGLKAAVTGCTHCKLCRTRTHTVFAAGEQTAPLMVIGEGPGADEDAQGMPFVGRAGKLLDEMLRAIGRSRTEMAMQRAVFIANVVKCRPPGNRDPEADEVAACRPYLDQQIALVRPKLIVALGRIAAQRLLSNDAPLSKLRGPLYEYGADRTPVLITYHPAYLLRSPGEKAKSWADLKRVHRFLAEAGAG